MYIVVDGEIHFLLFFAQSICLAFFFFCPSLSSNYLLSLHLFFHSLPSLTSSAVHTGPLFLSHHFPVCLSLLNFSLIRFFCSFVLLFLPSFYPPLLSLESTAPFCVFLPSNFYLYRLFISSLIYWLAFFH